MIYLNSIKRVIPSLVCLFIIIISCSESKYAKETNYFENYLEQIFNKKIQSAKKYYFIIPNSGCHGCRNTTINFMLSKDFNSKCIGIISKPDDKIIQYFKNYNNILIDKNCRIDKLNLQTANPVLIITENGNIIDIIPITVDNVQNIKQLLK